MSPATIITIADEVTAKQADALTKAIRATEILREKFWPQNPSAGLTGQALAAFNAVNDPKNEMHGNKVYAAIASLVTGQNIPVVGYKSVPASFLAVMVGPDGKPFLWVNSRGRGRYADGTATPALIPSVSTRDYRPATDAQVADIVNGLFAVRPALTLKLFFGSDAYDDSDEN